jgi:hypothetical protein
MSLKNWLKEYKQPLTISGVNTQQVTAKYFSKKHLVVKLMLIF